ncbi:hypothetical protein [Patulibacter minatonensis]|uniref:hypothetical protein n=1 Tax=Patulibacter minatonensis TaxID=298163 RepID=UPI000479C6C6|nr:hypothetical protein [Patulibacter minatonensis]
MSLLRRAPARIAGRRVLPWLVVLDLLREGQAHWQEQLTKRERSRLIGLLKDSKGVPSRLTAKDQAEFRALTAKLDLVALGKRAAVAGVGLRAARKKRR